MLQERAPEVEDPGSTQLPEQVNQRREFGVASRSPSQSPIGGYEGTVVHPCGRKITAVIGWVPKRKGSVQSHGHEVCHGQRLNWCSEQFTQTEPSLFYAEEAARLPCPQRVGDLGKP